MCAGDVDNDDDNNDESEVEIDGCNVDVVEEHGETHLRILVYVRLMCWLFILCGVTRSNVVRDHKTNRGGGDDETYDHLVSGARNQGPRTRDQETKHQGPTGIRD